LPDVLAAELASAQPDINRQQQHADGHHGQYQKYKFNHSECKDTN
jgi:hypothetical protein